MTLRTDIYYINALRLSAPWAWDDEERICTIYVYSDNGTEFYLQYENDDERLRFEEFARRVCAAVNELVLTGPEPPQAEAHPEEDGAR